jgi:hypothetical protein
MPGSPARSSRCLGDPFTRLWRLTVVPTRVERQPARADVRHRTHGQGLYSRALALAPRGRRQANIEVGDERRPWYPALIQLGIISPPGRLKDESPAWRAQ